MGNDGYFSSRAAMADEMIMKYLPAEEGAQKTIMEAFNYSMKAGGKRIRPLFMYEMYRLYNGSGKEVEPFMAAMEMVHTSSLVHDDLPCMDNDEFRRGKETTWKKYGEDMGTLTGDALMFFAYETAAKAFELGGDPQRIGRAIRILANKSGIYGMVGGQTIDLQMTGKKIDAETLECIYKLKTGALLEGSMMIGAVLGGAGEAEVLKIEEIAGDIGMAFQIQDDILDVTSTEAVLGKPIFSDEKNAKTTFVTLKGIAEAERLVDFYSQRALAGIASLSGTNPALNELVEKLIFRKM